jgi:hypothetical protein
VRMLERMARAQFELWRTRMNSIGEHPNSKHTFEDLSDREREFAFESARVMITAMKEPTEWMLSGYKDCFQEWRGNQRVTAHGVWLSMLDAVLNEPAIRRVKVVSHGDPYTSPPPDRYC